MNDPHIIFFTGASGSGKTTLIDALRCENDIAQSVFLHFDDIGVPPNADREWQKKSMYQWVKKLVNNYKNKKFIFFEGQVDILFIIDAFKAVNYKYYRIILVHCNDNIRNERLKNNRYQPELVNQEMSNWANYLYQQAKTHNISILDSSKMNVSQMIDWVRLQLEK